ncbi:putative FAD binding protein [Thozetella sp. PMI_491]|nr:putative FAD binding protein [Thozetella sp. PMI_491]
MDSQRRRLAALAALLSTAAAPAAALTIRNDGETDPVSTTTSSGSAPENTVGPYDTGLNGVNQPMNLLFKDMLWWTLGIFALLVLGVRTAEMGQEYLRRILAMSVPGEKQGYWKTAQWSWMPSLKRRLLYAPLWKKRHNREIRLSSAINMGTLPSRFHALILFIYLGSNLVYLFVLNWANENRYSFCAELRGRSGTLALVNMVPLIILAGRNNPLISLLKISFDTYNLLHRWLGRVVVLETLIHMIAWAVVQVADGGWESVQKKIVGDQFIGSGTVGTVAMVVLMILASSPIRHAFYETFLNTHIILAFIAFVCTWVHCTSAEIPGGLPQLPWTQAIVSIWIADRLARMLRMVYYNRSQKGTTEAIVEAMPGETTRVTMHLPRHVDIKPGTHAYLRFSGVSPWESHPFSIAWVQHTYQEESLPISEKETKKVKKPTSTSVSFVIGAQTGFTRKLFNVARGSGQRAVRMKAAFEGPYAGHHSLDSYGHAVLFAGATGITHQISYLKPLIEGYTAGTVATRRITLVWIVRDYEALEWVRPWMDAILRLPNRKALLHIKLFVTRPKNSREIVSASSTVQMFPGRPNISMLLAKEVAEQVGAMCVSVCGPGGLADDVRAAVRMMQGENNIGFLEESFT